MALEERVIPQWKRDAVKGLASEIKDSKMVGLVNVEGVGAKQLQGIRESLRGSAKIKMARNTLMRRAIEDVKVKGIEELKDFVKGPVAFVFSDQDPFILSKFLAENKAAAPAKGGQITPKDIIVPAMNTGVAPGPFITELAGLDIPSRVKGGVIHITEDTVAVEAGEVVSNAMAQMLGRLGIEPMELQLKLVAAYADGTVLTAEDFEIDLEELFSQVLLGQQYAINLSVNSGYPTTDTIPLILAKANSEAKILALEVGFFEPDMLGEFLTKANSQAFALASALAEKDPDAIPAEVLSQVQSAAAAAPPAVSDESAEEPEEEEEEEEEEATAGMGSLFG
ncbi:MAG: 50S ribosomal protein L10 [Candidatus Thorarchaeota archaeon]|nr:MAG: 50S ribosomal protein L10 [Candidatus Thorarchaeota archaeon]